MREIPVCMLVAGVLVGAPALLAAQTVTAQGGVSSSRLSISDENFTHTSDRRPGFLAGVSFAHPLPTRADVAVQIEGLVHVRGGNNVVRRGDALKLTYIDVPVLARVAVWQSGDRRLYALAGPQFGFNLAATYEDAGESEDASDGIKDVETSLTVGAGAAFGRFVIDGRFIWGLSGVFTEGDTGADFRNRTFAVTVGYQLGR